MLIYDPYKPYFTTPGFTYTTVKSPIETWVDSDQTFIAKSSNFTVDAPGAHKGNLDASIDTANRLTLSWSVGAEIGKRSYTTYLSQDVKVKKLSVLHGIVTVELEPVVTAKKIDITEG